MDIHVVPINDTYHHIESAECMCNPLRDEEEPSVVIHNAFDGRDMLYAN